jgi:hypothetical protein
MAFLIAYRDLRHPGTVGARVVSGELEVREAIGRLGREGYEVTSITPPLTKHDPLRRRRAGESPRQVSIGMIGPTVSPHGDTGKRALNRALAQFDGSPRVSTGFHS